MNEDQLKIMVEILSDRISRLSIEQAAAESASRIWKSKYEALVAQNVEKATKGVEVEEES